MSRLSFSLRLLFAINHKFPNMCIELLTGGHPKRPRLRLTKLWVDILSSLLDRQTHINSHTCIHSHLFNGHSSPCTDTIINADAKGQRGRTIACTCIKTEESGWCVFCVSPYQQQILLFNSYKLCCIISVCISVCVLLVWIPVSSLPVFLTVSDTASRQRHQHPE